jgi:hypothetical protein
MVDNGSIGTCDLCIFILVYRLVEAFFLRSVTYTRNIKLQAVVKTGTAGSVIKLKRELSKILQTVEVFINESSYF